MPRSPGWILVVLISVFAGPLVNRATPATASEVEPLSLLCKVWGFAKYHHPVFTGGQRDVDEDLLALLAPIRASRDLQHAQLALARWLESLGSPEPCTECSPPDPDAVLVPQIDWIGDEDLVGNTLGRRLHELHQGRHGRGAQHYVSLHPSIGNPSFTNERNSTDEGPPGEDMRLLALFRLWNVVEYWFPYRDQIEGDRDDLLREFIPRFAAAEDTSGIAYAQEVIQFCARIGDGHFAPWPHLHMRPPFGAMEVPITLRFVEEELVVTGYSHEEAGPATTLLPGDVVRSIDGVAVAEIVASLEPWYSASNRPARLHSIARTISRGTGQLVQLQIERAGSAMDIEAGRLHLKELDRTAALRHDRPGPAFQWLDDEVAYLKLSEAEEESVASYLDRARQARMWILDIRSYPKEFLVFDLGQHLVQEQTPFARFSRGDYGNPGTFTANDVATLAPAEPLYAGKLAILVDESTMSMAEYTAMAFRVAPGALVFGSTTAGADGNVSSIPLPMAVAPKMSGIGVFYPDGTRTQRVGILPDVELRPTIEGIREGRDEVLEAAVRHMLGRELRLTP